MQTAPKSSEATLLTLPTIARSFPPRPEPYVSRPPLTDALDRLFKTGADTVVLIDSPGHGRTTLARAFAELHRDNTISVFARPASRWGYEPLTILYDLANQINWLLTGKELDEDADIDHDLLRQLYARLQRRIGRGEAHFVVDGLDEIPPHDQEIRSAILSLLPFGIPNFRYLLTGESTFDSLDGAYRCDVLERIAPALYKASPLIALEEIGQAPEHARDHCLLEVASFILQKAPSSEPFDPIPEQRYDVNVSEMQEVLQLAEHADRRYRCGRSLSESN